MKDGLAQGTVIIGATVAFAAFAWTGIVDLPPPKCEAVTVVSYFPAPEPQPLYRTPPLGWPIEDRAIELHDEPKPEKAVITEDDADEPPRRHHYRRHRRGR